MIWVLVHSIVLVVQISQLHVGMINLATEHYGILYTGTIISPRINDKT